ncbi:MAG: hypothetical protein IRZ33_11485 [Alicyclobacillaceae bacterium]|nr:hypothetical protein [Alicyclobacillaceae bacterium]
MPSLYPHISWRADTSAMVPAYPADTLTSMLQLGFGRDGRLYHIAIDTIGIALAGRVWRQPK